MIHAQNDKRVQVILPQSVGTTEVTGTVDTLGFNYAVIEFSLNTAAASSVITTAAVSEGDTTSAFTAIAALTGGTSTDNFTLPTPSTTGDDVGNKISMKIDLKGRKRYLKVGLASTTARLCVVEAKLWRGDTIPSDDTSRGATTVIA